MNLDADVGQIIKNLFNKNKSADAKKDSAGKKASPSLSIVYYKQAILKCVIIICVTIAVCLAIDYFTRSSTTKDTSDFASNQELKDAVVKIEQDIPVSTAMLGKNRKKVEEILPMFSNIEGSKMLFKLISGISEQNNLIIKNLSQGEVTETLAPARYLQTRILLEMEGYFQNYINFKNTLSQQKPLLRIESENVKLVMGKDGERKLQIKLNLIDYSINKKEYENTLNK